MASGFRTADGTYADGSWELRIRVTDLPAIKNEQGDVQTEDTIPVLVRSEDSVGYAISRLVEALKKKLDITQDWSDYEMWWPKKNKWLMNSNHALVREEVQADAALWFTKKHKTLRVQLPDLQYANIRVDFSAKVFSAVKEVCRFFDIRRPEELSFLRLYGSKNAQNSHKNSPQRHANGNSYNEEGLIAPNVLNPSMTPTSPYTPGSPMYNTLTPKNKGGPLSANSLELLDAAFINPQVLIKSPTKPSPAALANLFRPKSLHDKAQRNMGWLDSSKSLMEQDVKENQTMLLRFKFFSFYDLSAKYDSIRINQLYEQARWTLLCEVVDCTEEEMIMFASLQYHISQLADNVTEEVGDDDKNKDIDEALHELEDTLGMGGSNPKGDITSVPELADYLKFFKPKKFAFKSYKKYWFTFKDTMISYYKTKEDAASLNEPVRQFSVKGAEVIPDVNIRDNKYVIRLLLPTAAGMCEVELRCDTDVIYSRWMAACKLAAKGRTMADSSYNTEVDNLKTLLKMQKTGSGGSHSGGSGGSHEVGNIEPEFFVARRHLKKLGNKQVMKKIQESVTYYNSYNSINAKLSYIKAWQGLPEFGQTHFYVRFKGARKEELVAFAFNRLIRMEPSTGEALKTWRYNTMKEWSVNWESKNLIINVASDSKKPSEGDREVSFICTRASPKLLHEFLGGYIFLSMRNKDSEDRLDEDLFHKLTGGSIESDGK